MWKAVKFCVWFGLMAGLGILVGCYIHGQRVNQPTIMSGVAFVRALPYGEWTVGMIETMVFSYQERKALEDFKDQHRGKIKIDPEVQKRHEDLFRK